MARKAEATLWMLVKIGKRSMMKRVVQKGRSYVPKIKCPSEPGSYYLRYTQNAKRRVESVGNDLTIALQEQRARQQALDASTGKRQFDAIVVWRFDRFARSTKHLLLALEEFRSLGIQFIS